MFRRFWKQTGPRRVMLLEAAAYLILARLALKTLSFSRVIGLLVRNQAATEVVGEARKRMREEVAWAIDRVTATLPGQTVCFPRAIAAQAMLRRRNISTVLYYGAAKSADRNLNAHVWLQDGTEGVVGHSNAADYNVLAYYPKTS